MISDFGINILRKKGLFRFLAPESRLHVGQFGIGIFCIAPRVQELEQGLHITSMTVRPSRPACRIMGTSLLAPLRSDSVSLVTSICALICW